MRCGRAGSSSEGSRVSCTATRLVRFGTSKAFAWSTSLPALVRSVLHETSSQDVGAPRNANPNIGPDILHGKRRQQDIIGLGSGRGSRRSTEDRDKTASD